MTAQNAPSGHVRADSLLLLGDLNLRGLENLLLGNLLEDAIDNPEKRYALGGGLRNRRVVAVTLDADELEDLAMAAYSQWRDRLPRPLQRLAPLNWYRVPGWIKRRAYRRATDLQPVFERIALGLLT